jgi:hypothetical protein
MKRNPTRTQRQNFFSYGLNRLTPQNQTRLEDYIAQLAKDNETAPMPQNPTGKNPKKTVKQKKGKTN